MRRLSELTIVLGVVTLLFPITAQGQDAHFSQFDASPLLNNPGNAGVFNGKFRGSLNYKEQWSSVVHFPYLTYAASGDMTLMPKRNNANIGVGLTVLKDEVGEISMAKTSVNLSISGIVKVSDKHVVSLGIQSGFVQNSIDPSKLQWGNQFNGIDYVPEIDPQEDLGDDGFLTADFAVGAVYTLNGYDPSSKSSDPFAVSAGIAMHHLARPRSSVNGDDNIWRRYNFFVNGRYDINDTKFSVEGVYMFQSQGPSKENLLGVIGVYDLKRSKGGQYTQGGMQISLKAGSYYRFGDAISPYIGFEINGIGLGITYDMNISQLREASNLKGGLEVALHFRLGGKGGGSARMN